MANLAFSNPQSFADAVEFLRGKSSRAVGYKTVMHRIDADTIAIRQHSTDIAIYRSDDTGEYQTGGWYTPTTKARISEFMPPTRGVGQDKGWWFVHGFARNAEHGYWQWDAAFTRVPFSDGIRIRLADGAIIDNPGASADDAHNARTKRAIAKFIRGLTDERIRAIVADAETNGTAGDCWYCKASLSGGSFGDCLADHVAEDYAHVTLFIRALVAKGYPIPGVILRHNPDLTRRAVRRLLSRELLRGAAAHNARG